MSRPVHTPYDGSALPFTIGLKPLDPVSWLEVDEERPRYLAEKERLWASDRDAVFVQTQASHAAQEEALRLVDAHLRMQFPDLPPPEGDGGLPPLWRAARRVQEDLVVMERREDGWRLTSASLSFPSSWSLAEKFDKPMDAIHAPVPGFGPGTRNAALIARMFDNLKPERPVWRINWSLYPDGDLHHPKPKDGEAAGAGPAESIFIRVERQTLRRLPETGALLFTVRIHLDPLAAIAAHGEGARLAAALRAQLEALSAEEAGYKGLGPRKADLQGFLRRLERTVA